jgi:hypothetical protein
MAPSTVTLEIDVQSEPITGRIVNAGRTRQFCGWLELAAALQAAMEASDVADGVREA